MRKLFASFIFLVAPAVFASGGTCPSGANYLNPTNPTGAHVTLATLGITNCYFVAANGSDANDGLSEASGHPWLHAPQMPNCSSACATAQNVSGGIPAGTGIILRGGDTWHMGNSSLTPYVGGTWDMNSGQTPAGSSSHPLYFGVDVSWFTGGAWARPILNADNSLCNASTVGTLPDGSTCTGGTDSFGQPLFTVNTCAFQISATNNFFNFASRQYFIIDNFEMVGLCQSSIGQPAHHDTFFDQASLNGPMFYENNYMHGISHLPFAAKNGFPGCTGSTVCFNIFVGQGGSTGAQGDHWWFNATDFSDSDPAGTGLNFQGLYDFAYNVVRYTSQSLPDPTCYYHDNLIEYFFENGHSNLLESINCTGISVMYNNVFRHVENLLSSGGGIFLWPGPVATTDSMYAFGNVAYDVGSVEYFNIGGLGITTNQGHYIIFNNTFQSNIAQAVVNCSGQSVGTTVDTNNHWIDDHTPYVSCPSLTSTTSLWQSNTSGGSAPTYSDANITAHFDQYTGSQTFAYSPVATTNSTVAAGTNVASTFIATLLASGDPNIVAAGVAAQSDTGYACVYNPTPHTVTCPARTTVVRPASAAPDVGAYQFTPGGGGAPIAPTGALPLATITVQPAPVAALLITTATMSNGTVGAAYPQTPFTFTGGKPPITWTATGMPPGVVISTAGVPSGTPTTAGSYLPKVTASDSSTPALTATASLAIVIAAAPTPSVVAGTAPAKFQVSVPVSWTFTATNCAATVCKWGFTGTMIPGLTLVSTGNTTAALSGTPTTAGSYSGISITVQ